MKKSITQIIKEKQQSDDLIKEANKLLLKKDPLFLIKQKRSELKEKERYTHFKIPYNKRQWKHKDLIK